MRIDEPIRQSSILLVPIASVHVLNPRTRNQKVFAGLVENISTVGLKRPITVSRARAGDRNEAYDLICGQGRLEACKALGETHIAASVVQASEADRYLMSLVENLARRRHKSGDLLGAIRALDERGYTGTQIAAKTGLATSYIHGIVMLLKAGEARLIGAVEQGWLPMRLACDIARVDDAGTQVIMMNAYQDGLLKGDQLLKVRRLIDQRRMVGRNYERWKHKAATPLTANRLLQTYQREVRRQRMAVKKAEISESRLLFVVSAVRRLMADEHFRTVLRAEGIETMPAALSERLQLEAQT
ncbi:plasmid partitioning protein RepB C-terminal domain-containing protein [Aureimonas frigidaquae]|uniref:plasmid partitioning protein RepB C-terminal domain-containing protein n=1 Tax=Aureimonas frigidaquae TaxID=424757 RepID=UPI000782632A|nr:plasmid partitioning protein RepB C-terminal domain-containing protein [Aureimonas frigidaquae]